MLKKEKLLIESYDIAESKKILQTKRRICILKYSQIQPKLSAENDDILQNSKPSKITDYEEYIAGPSGASLMSSAVSNLHLNGSWESHIAPRSSMNYPRNYAYLHSPNHC